MVMHSVSYEKLKWMFSFWKELYIKHLKEYEVLRDAIGLFDDNVYFVEYLLSATNYGSDFYQTP